MGRTVTPQRSQPDGAFRAAQLRPLLGCCSPELRDSNSLVVMPSSHVLWCAGGHSLGVELTFAEHGNTQVTKYCYSWDSHTRQLKEISPIRNSRMKGKWGAK